MVGEVERVKLEREVGIRVEKRMGEKTSLDMEESEDKKYWRWVEWKKERKRKRAEKWKRKLGKGLFW